MKVPSRLLGALLLAGMASVSPGHTAELPAALPLPGPIACNPSCASRLAELCTRLGYRYFSGYAAARPPNQQGDWANGVCLASEPPPQ